LSRLYPALQHRQGYNLLVSGNWCAHPCTIWTKARACQIRWDLPILPVSRP
jgi:hypothetical protein